MREAYHLPYKTKLLWQIRCAFAALILAAAVSFLFFFTKWAILPLAVILAAGIFFLFVYLPFYFKSYEIIVSEGAVMVKRGVFFRNKYIMPYPRLVFVSSFSTPLSRAMGLCAVVLKAARGMILIPEMSAEDAMAMMKGISEEKK